MHNRDKYPEIWPAFEKAREEKAAILATTKGLKDELKALTLKQDDLKQKKIAVREKINEIERPALVELNQRIGAMATAMGGKSLSDKG